MTAAAHKVLTDFTRCFCKNFEGVSLLNIRRWLPINCCVIDYISFVSKKQKIELLKYILCVYMVCLVECYLPF